MGRKSKLLDPQVRETILEYIRKGNYIKTACMAAGVSERTYYDWVAEAERGGGNGHSEIYSQFLLDLKKARADNIAFHVANIHTASLKNNQWTASAWLLERMNPAEYGKRLELEVGPSKVLIALQEQARKSLQRPEVALLSEAVVE